MNAIERKFLLAVERGDLATLKSLLNSNQRSLDINCCDPLARNALIIAIDNENLEMVKLLLEAKIRVGDALLYAIDENFVEAVELLLDHEQATNKTGRTHSWQQDRENSFFSADMTPLILAAHRNNFEVIKILLDRRVSPIPDPHQPRCDCKACSSARAEDCLRHSRSRINAYRALASPCLMALSSSDPLLSAFEMSAKLESLAKMEPEYKQDYLRLRAQCQTFATRLLDHTRTSKELEILLNYSDEYLDEHEHTGGAGEQLRQLCRQDRQQLYEVVSLNAAVSSSLDQLAYLATTDPSGSPSVSSSETSSVSFSNSDARSSKKFFSHTYDAGHLRATQKDSILSLDSVTGRHESYRSHMRLARLRLAIQCKQKTFCAHPNVQELLANMWYENLPGFRRKHPIAQGLQIVLIGLMFPVYSIAYLVAPQSQLGRYIKKPFIKFICHSASYITFLLVLILASQRVEAFYCWDSVISLFSKQPDGPPESSHNFTSFVPNFHSLKYSLSDSKVFESVANYLQISGGGGGSSSAGSGARGLDFSKIFVQLPPSSKMRGTLPSPIELVILLWVLSLIWAEIKQVHTLGINYYRADMWNTLDSVASAFYIGTIILRIVSYCQMDEASKGVAREHWHAYDPTLLSEGLFAAGTIFSALKLVYIFSVNPYLGPLQISLGRMIIDILRFSWIYMLVLFSFACGMNQLLWYYADLERHQCLNITNYSLAQYYSAQQELAKHEPSTPNYVVTSGAGGGQTAVIERKAGEQTATLPPLLSGNGTHNMTDDQLTEAAFSASLEDDSSKPPITIDDSCKTWRHFSNVFESSQTLFWATFGLVDLENFDLTGIRQYTRFWALLMFGCYCFINVVVVLNLLIAMMNHSYVKISKKSDIEWKFARTRLWMSYFDTGSTVPAPFNIIPSIKSIINLIKYLSSQLCRLAHHLLRVGFSLVTAAATAATSTAATGNPDVAANRRAGFVGGGGGGGNTRRLDTFGAMRERARRNCSLTASYRNVMRVLVRRYLVNEQRLLERKRELTEAKLNRWAKLNAFE